MTVGNHEFDAGDDVLAAFVSILPLLPFYNTYQLASPDGFARLRSKILHFRLPLATFIPIIKPSTSP